jgi:hypothetical protein
MPKAPLYGYPSVVSSIASWAISSIATATVMVFCTQVGTPLNRNNIHTRSFKPLVERASLPHLALP